jgi:predicted transposase/invertase (TIGR01784 family)
MSYDNACKYLSEKYPAQFATWILGKTPTSVEVLKTELSIEPIRADYVTFLRTQERILHLEFEVDVEGEPPLPLRMLDYWVRLYRRYRVPITQTLILLKESASARRLTDTFRVENTQHRYRIIRLWEETPESFLQNPALLPLASLCQTSSPDQLLGKVAEELGKIEGSVERGQIAACTEILAGLRFNKTLIKQLFREDIMRESVIYQDILQQGQKQALKTSILEALETRFGAAPPELNFRLEALTPERLHGLLRLAWTCVTVNDFISQLA